MATGTRLLAERVPPGFVVCHHATSLNFTHLGTMLVVPMGHVAVQAGTWQIFTPGQHKIRSLLSPTHIIALVSQASFTVFASVHNLLAGGSDSELLDGEIRYGLAIADAVLFFQTLGMRQREVRVTDLAGWFEPEVRTTLAVMLRQYLIGDLTAEGPAAEKVQGRLRERLAVTFADFGLALNWVQTPVLYRSEERLTQARRAQALHRKTRRADVDTRLDEIQWQSLARLVSQDGVHFKPAEERKAETLLRQQIIIILKSLLAAARDDCSRVYRAGDTELALRLQSLQRQIECIMTDVANTLVMGFRSNHALPDWPLTWQELESLLLHAQNLAGVAQTALRYLPAGQSTSDVWTSIEIRLVEFQSRWIKHKSLFAISGGTHEPV